MLSLDTGDKIRADATNGSQVDFTVFGLLNNALKQLADGQLAASIGDLYTAASQEVVTSIILVNTGAGINYINLYLTTAGSPTGTRRLIPKSLALGSNCSLHFEGGKMQVFDPNGNLLVASGTAVYQ